MDDKKKEEKDKKHEEVQKKYEEIEKAVEEYNGRKVYRDDKTGRFASNPYPTSKDNGINYGARQYRVALMPENDLKIGTNTSGRRSRFART